MLKSLRACRCKDVGVVGLRLCRSLAVNEAGLHSWECLCLGILLVILDAGAIQEFAPCAAEPIETCIQPLDWCCMPFRCVTRQRKLSVDPDGSTNFKGKMCCRALNSLH
jgi:hypothetical protein